MAANDHLRWRRPWLDGLSALAAVAAAAGAMTLATTVALPVVRHPAVLAAALTSMAALHAGIRRRGHRARVRPRRLRRRRCPLRGTVVAVRRGCSGPAAVAGRDRPAARPSGYASWGSPVRLRALVSDADGWIASGYNARPSAYAATRAALDGHLRAVGSRPERVPGHDRHDVDADHRQRRRRGACPEDVLGPALGRTREPRPPARRPTRALPPGARGVRGGGCPPRGALADPDGLRQLRRYADEVVPHLRA